MGKAAELASERLDADAAYLTSLRDMLIEGVLTGIEESYLNGHPRQRLPNNVNLRFTGIEGESLILALNHKGIAASTGSACTSKTLEPSHVLMAIGLNEVEAHGSLLLTLGRYNTKEEVEYVLETLKEVVAKLRAMSPLWGKPLELEKWKSRLEEGRIGGEVELT
jgi:cysteine desulfurase